MAKFTYHKANGSFGSRTRAHYISFRGKKYYLPKTKKSREKIIERVRKNAARPSFSDKIKSQGLRAATSPPTQARYFTENKTLNIPGQKDKTFDIEKNIFQLNKPLKINARNIERKIRFLKKNSYPHFLKTFKKHKGRNFLFRIDTAYINESKEFSKVLGVFKKDKDGLSDGRGFSLGRMLNITSLKKFKKYIDDTFALFIKSFETYLARSGIAYGQINALILEIS